MITAFKESFTRLPQLVHLNNAGLAPSSRQSLQAVKYWMERFHLEGMHCDDDYMAAAEIARKDLSILAGADAGEIAFFQSTAGAISQMAFGMDLKLDDEVLVWDQEYPSNLYPWKVACERSGACLKIVASASNLSTPLENILSQVTAKTRVIAVSWVQFQTGALTDIKALAEFAQARGIWTVVDIIQGFGLLPFNFQALGIDAACGGSHKWLVSPVGVGFLIVKKEHVPKIKPLTIGASTYGTCNDRTNMNCLPKLDAHRFESGSKQVLEIMALGASAKLIRETGVSNIQKESERLSHLLRKGLQAKGFQIHSPALSATSFVNFSHPTLDIPARLKAAGISFALRGPGVRLTPHAFNSDEDIARTLTALT
jgi:selenocysteine lyase/cysteine desulfurase